MQIRTTGDLAAVARGRREELGWSLLALSTKSGLSRPWLVDFENGKATAEVGKVLRVLETLGFDIHLAIHGASVPLPGGGDEFAITRSPQVSDDDDLVDLDGLLDEYRRNA